MIIGEEYGQCHKPMHCRPGEQHSRGNDSVRARVGRSLLLAYIGVKNMCPVRDSSRRMSLALRLHADLPVQCVYADKVNRFKTGQNFGGPYAQKRALSYVVN